MYVSPIKPSTTFLQPLPLSRGSSERQRNRLHPQNKRADLFQYNQGGQQGYGAQNPYAQNPSPYQDSGNPYAQQGGNQYAPQGGYAQQGNYGGRPQYQQQGSSNYNDPEQGNAGYGKLLTKNQLMVN